MAEPNRLPRALSAPARASMQRTRDVPRHGTRLCRARAHPGREMWARTRLAASVEATPFGAMAPGDLRSATVRASTQSTTPDASKRITAERAPQPERTALAMIPVTDGGRCWAEAVLRKTRASRAARAGRGARAARGLLCPARLYSLWALQSTGLAVPVAYEIFGNTRAWAFLDRFRPNQPSADIISRAAR